ncbi:LexA family protein [Paludibacterium paludis]|uniref:SOS (Error prone) mutagenesis protein UmuD (RumA) n=1 Tax=Paludibacterium paludis TaxID=1225769 RepID=A0A918P1J7_9NEIS|nr:translesion error-prone DNA polymerase V autoproteolytic subunit [Paludibacterium paludis]GGY13217.1 SOS (error prone) mutagenesis protein UmuD (RumA) [Paludibacterium paludis]
MTQGGKRAGAGRKSAYGGDKTVAIRIPEPLKPVLEAWLGEYRILRSARGGDIGDVRTLGRDLDAMSLPLFASRVPAGAPVAGDDMKEADIDLNEHLVARPDSTFMVTVRGQSMRDAGIQDGDLLLVDRSIEPKSGKVVVAVLDGDVTVKRLDVTGDRVRLLPENPEYSPIDVPPDSSFLIWGVVTRVIHTVD